MLNILNNYIFIIFLLGLALSNNLILFFISWVGLNMALYAILLKSYNSYSIEMTLKYFISGAIITIFLLISILFYFIEFFNFSQLISNYVTFYSFNFKDSGLKNLDFLNFSKIQKYFYVTILTALLFKLGSFPFHFYIVEIYEALSIRKSMFIYTILLKVIVFFTLIKIITNFWYLNDILITLFSYSGIGSLLVSSFSSIKQLRLRKIFAYSYLNAIGLVLLALAYCNCENFGTVAVAVSKYYFFSYILAWFGIWNILVYYSRFTRFTDLNKLDYISDLLEFFYYRWSYIKVVTSLLVFILSLAGLPPFLGFFTKALIFFSLSSSKISIALLFFCLLTTPIMAFTYLRLIIYIVTSIIDNSNDSRFNVFMFNSEFFFYVQYKLNTFNYSLGMLKFSKVNKVFFDKKLSYSRIKSLKKRYLINYIFNYKTCAIFILISPILFVI